MTPLLVALPGNEAMAAALADGLGGELGVLATRRFPDEESYVRFDTPLERRRVVLVCTLDRPDAKFLPLIFAADAARDLGAVEVGLVAPYLAYMRQDRRFHPGEAVTSTTFAKALGARIDWLATVDPHLHRRASLSEIYAVPTSVARAAPAISAWIARAVDRPLLVGPDSESAQWVAAVADGAGAPSMVLEKTRRGDRDVAVTAPDLSAWPGRTPVVVDDIISSGETMIATVARLTAAGAPPPVCVGVHAVFAEGAYQALLDAGAARVVTANTIAHPSNAIDVAQALVESARGLMGDGSEP